MKKLYFIISVIIIIPFIFVSCNNSSTESTGTEENELHQEAESNDTSAGHSHDSTEYSLMTIRKEPFSFSIKTGGRIMVDSKDIVIITAKTSGIVSMVNDYLFPGVKIGKGDIMFTISGSQLAEGNTELTLRQVKADLDEASANYERAKKLIADKIITEENFLSVKNNYDKLLNEYENLSSTSGSNGNVVSSPGAGYIKELFVVEGQKVEPGQELASIVSEHNLVLRADISPDKLSIIPSVESANFTVGYSKRLYKISEMNGRKISHGKSTGESSFYVPVYFRMDFMPELIDGTFAEVYLIGKEAVNAITVPDDALLEEYGKLFVYVADDDGEFLKRYVETGNGDGEKTMIISGLEEGEKIVSSGAYHIKISQTSTAVPSHNHNH
ncbi:MAG TPA: efflux RND transporter periplasmic adaptor subunit [Bacteroidales bacterium]|nr:efflux RND transporter periplasmic adaptor subunit [Bacteroidales bacterium]